MSHEPMNPCCSHYCQSVVKLRAADVQALFAWLGGVLLEGKRAIVRIDSRILHSFRGVKFDALSDHRAYLGGTVCPLSTYSFTLAHIIRGHLSPTPNPAARLGPMPAQP